MSLLPDAERVRAKRRRAVAWWLFIGVAMILVQILLGGVTRLTGSGLSITEWKPILGAVPPMNEHDWNAAFELYKVKAVGQYINHNSDYTLADFKAIYFWEWLHREWARLLGVVFIIGFVFFLARKYFDRNMVTPFVILFLLGALQGAVGWIMVASGLNPDDTHVSHIKLALHFMFALVLLCYTFWFALKLLLPEEKRIVFPKLNSFSLLLLVLLTIQLIYGAFMAGLKAAPAAATWPDVNGTYIPENVSSFGANTYTGLHILTDQPIVIHYIHRTLAYVLFVLVCVWFAQSRRLARQANSSLLLRASFSTLAFIVLQVLLGIITVLNAPLMTQNKFLRFELFAELHQMVAICLLMSLLLNFYLVKKK
ncbi:MAG: COX15/CtaA family protein [Chitinophagaceae bacterium]|nr:COX15/CtaA family protein [Chitinophagaceae bacterium]